MLDKFKEFIEKFKCIVITGCDMCDLSTRSFLSHLSKITGPRESDIDDHIKRNWCLRATEWKVKNARILKRHVIFGELENDLQFIISRRINAQLDALLLNIPSHNHHVQEESYLATYLREKLFRIDETQGEFQRIRTSQDPSSSRSAQTSQVPLSETSDRSEFGSYLTPGPKNHPAEYNSLITPNDLVDMFMKYASGNTKKGHETLGYLAGPKEQEGNHIVTTLIVPKQKTATDSCESTEEESVLAMFESKNLVLLGWIHTHPCHRLFFSATDMHMQLEIQKMFKEAIGIVGSTDGDFRVKNQAAFHLTDLGVRYHMSM